jgi:OOP family OmpA-OmpF porin
VGYGSERPLASNATSAGRAINRRIDILIIPEAKPI